MSNAGQGPEYAVAGVAGRGASPGRAAVVAAVLVALVGAAVAKPWQVAPGPPVPAAAATVRPSSDSPTASPPIIDPTPVPLPAPITLAMLIEYHNAWGVRAIVGRSELSERWVPAPLPMPSGAPTPEDVLVRILIVPAAERPLRLLGLTTPMDVELGDVEIAVATPDEQTDELEFRPTHALPWRGRTLLFTPADGGEWPPGIYQFRLETGGEATSITVAVFVGPSPRQP